MPSSVAICLSKKNLCFLGGALMHLHLCIWHWIRTESKNWISRIERHFTLFPQIQCSYFVFRHHFKLQFDFLFAFSKFAIKIKSRHWKLFSFKSRLFSNFLFFANCFGRYKSSLTFMWKDKAILSFPKSERVQLTRGVTNEFVISIKHSLCNELTSPVT